MDPEVIGRYRVIGAVGAGGFATVYRAHDPALDREVAVKLLHPHLSRNAGTRERFVREGRSLARVHHPNIVQVFDSGDSEAGAYLAMEFVPGQSLEEIASERSLPLAELAAIIRQVAAAIEAIHAAGLVHRDIKPANILITDHGRAVLLDLGIARSTEGTAFTATGMLVGTPGYLAPEQVEGGIGVGPWTDVYQLGATVYALLTGRPPFEGDTSQVLYAIVNRAPPDLGDARPDLPRPLLAAVSLAMAKNPAHRPARPSEFAAALDGSLDAFTRVLQPPSLPPLPAPSPGQTPAPYWASPLPQSISEQVTPPAIYRSPSLAPPEPAARPRTASAAEPAVAAPSMEHLHPPGRGWWPLALAAGIVGLLVIGGALALRGGNDNGRPADQVRDATSASTMAASATASGTPVPATVVAASAVPTASPTRAAPTPVRIAMPTEPARRIPIPDGMDPNERAVLAVLNLNGSTYIAAMRGPDEGPLRDIFTGPAFEQYAKFVADLRAAGHYEVDELVTISLTGFVMDGPDAARATTIERWRAELYERDSGRRLRGNETVYTEEYRFVRRDGQWLIHTNIYAVVSATPN